MREVEDHLREVGADLERRGRELEKRGRELEKHGDNLLKRGDTLLKRGGKLLEKSYKKLEHDGLWSSVTITEFAEDAGRHTTTSGSTQTEIRQMRYFLIVYEPKGGGNSAALTKTLQKMDAWWNFMDRVWIVNSDETASALWNRLTGLFGKNDNVLVIELPNGPDRQGWLPEKAWDWFNKSMPRGKQVKPVVTPMKLGIPYSAYQDDGAVLIVPEGIKVQVTRGVESVHFADSAESEPASPQAEPLFQSAKSTLSIPPVEPTPSPTGQEMLNCDFCGCEAPAYMWANGDCPRCGIGRK